MMKKILALFLAATLAFPPLVHAQGIPLVRDTEVEELLKDYTRPLFRVSGVGVNAVQIYLVADGGFNAFVASGRRIFVNTGALTASKTPNQIIGVLAHETGHIAGGHLSRLRQQLENAQTLMIIGMLLGGAAVAGAAASGQRDIGSGVAGAIAGPAELARRSILSYQRGEEAAADRAAISYLAKTGQSAKGMIETFERFASDSLFTSRRTDPYLISHPVPNDRIAQIRELAAQSSHYNTKDPASLQVRHDMMRAKLIGFTGRFETVNRAYPLSDTSLPARYARAISKYRNGQMREGVSETNALIASQPNNPYFYELKGQILLEGGQPNEALAPLRKAVALKPNAGLLRALLGHALVASGNPKEGITTLLAATSREPEAIDAYKQLAIAYGQTGEIGKADLAEAQAAFLSGDYRTAAQMAAKAKQTLPANSPQYLKADEIHTYKRPTQ